MSTACEQARPRRTLHPVRARGPLSLLFLVAAVSIAGAQERAPLVTTRDRAAESAFHAAMEALDGGDDAAGQERLRAFLYRFPNDALVPRARLELGRLLLARYDGAAPSALDDAESSLARAMEAGDPPVRDRARLYAAIVAFHRGRNEQVIETLTALRGRLVIEEDSRLLLSTLAAACERTGNRLCTVEALDRRVTREDDEGVREPLDRELGRVIEALSPAEANALFDSLSPDGPAWSRVAIVVLRKAYENGDLARAAEVARALRTARVSIEDAELRALALHVERATEVAPYVIGAIVPLRGPLAARGQSMLRGLTLGTGLPPTAPFGRSALQIALRDHGGRPDVAVRAVDELFTLHRVTAIVAPPDEASARAVAERASALGLPVIVLDARVAAGNAISLGVASADEVAALVATARGLGARRFAVLRASDDRRAFLDAAVPDAVALGRVDLDPGSMRQTLDSVLAHTPDAIVVGVESRDAGRLLAALEAALRARRVRTRPRLLFVSTAFSTPLLAHARRTLEGALVAQTETRGSEGFRARYESRFGESPDPLARLAYDAASALATALADGTADRRVVEARLRATLGATAPERQEVSVREVVSGRLVMPRASTR